MKCILTSAALFLLLSISPAYGGMYAIDEDDLKGEPTVYATVKSAPDPTLMGCWMRLKPKEYKRPNKYAYCLVEKDGKYAVYYVWKDGKTLAEHRGWAPFVINGKKLSSSTEPSRYLVEDGVVLHNYGGRKVKHKMKKFD